jgi:ribosome-binding factor A
VAAAAAGATYAGEADPYRKPEGEDDADQDSHIDANADADPERGGVADQGDSRDSGADARA